MLNTAEMGIERSKSYHLGVRLDRGLLSALDREMDRLRAERPGARISRSDTVREILHRTLRLKGSER